MALDAQDWSSVSTGGWRYAGALAYSGAGTFTLPVTITGAERAIIVMLQETAMAGALFVFIETADGSIITGGLSTPSQLATNAIPIVGYVNAQITTHWRVRIPSGVGFAGTAYVFVDTALPDRALVSGFSAMPVTIGIGGIPVGPNSPLPVIAGGLMTSDPTGAQVSVRQHGAAPYDSWTHSRPGVNTPASIVFAATPGLRWIIGEALYMLRSTAAVAATVTGRVVDGFTVIAEFDLSIPATATAIDRFYLGPGSGLAGSTGNAVTVDLSVGGGANTFLSVHAGAYLSY